MVTIRQIAAACGYSKASVWLALNGNPRLPAKTRDKILKAATELGYRPNPAYRQMLRQVRAGKPIEYQSTLGLLHGFDYPNPEERIDYHRELVSAFVERAKEFGYEVEKFWLNNPEIRLGRLTSILESRGIKGLICMPLPKHRHIEMDFSNFALVTIGFTVLNPGLNRVEFNNQDATALCIRKLFQCGYRKIGFVQRRSYELWRDYTLSVPFLWMQSKQAAEDRSEILFVDENSRNEFLVWFRDGGFDALIVNHEIVVKWLREEGMGIPRDVGVVFPTPTAAYENFAHVNQHPRRVGAAAADVLMAQVQREEFGCPRNPKTLNTDVSWRDGDSIRRVGPPREWYDLHI